MSFEHRLKVIFEGIEQGYEQLSDTEANQKVKETAKNFRPQQGVYTFINKDSVEDADYLILNPSEKASSYNGKYHEIIMDELLKWEDYPQRGKSIISYTNNEQDKESEGTPYIVIPQDNANVGICPKDNIEKSFNFVAINLGIKFAHFDKALNLLLNIFNNPEGTYEEPTKKLTQENLLTYDADYETFRKALDTVDENFFTDEGKTLSNDISVEPYNKETEDSVISIMQYMKAKDLKLIEVINKLFDPKENGFKVIPFNKFIIGENKNKEVWIDKPCILVKESSFENIKFETIEPEPDKEPTSDEEPEKEPTDNEETEPDIEPEPEIIDEPTGLKTSDEEPTLEPEKAPKPEEDEEESEEDKKEKK